jgi:hypothetical protein
MKNESDQQAEQTIWEINKMKAKLARQERTIRLLKLYNEQDRKRLTRLTNNKKEISNFI